MENYSNAQLLKVQERILMCEQLNKKIGSNVKITDLKLFSDELNNIFVSYLSEDLSGDINYEVFYFKYDKEGKETVLNRAGFSKDELENMFSKFKKLNLSL